MTSRTATLERVAIAARIPHQGSMCLLDAVDAWDGESIRCRATSHHHPANPLRDASGLPATAAIEYAAQAMALHGALLAPADSAPRPGYLASVRGVQIAVPLLDDIPGELEIRADRMTGNDSQVLYTFTVSGAGMTLVSGRAAVILDTGAPGAGLSRSPA